MKKILFLIIACSWFQINNLFAMVGDFQASQVQTAQAIAQTANQRSLITPGSESSSASSSSTNSQSTCASTDPATASMPYFIINWYGSTTKAAASAPLLSSFTFPTNQVQGSGGFWVNNAILTINLFPPSNIITSTAISPISGTANSYAIMYTLKSLDGNIIQKAIQYVSSTQTTPIMPITSGAPQIPTSLSISTIPVPTTPPANPAPTPTIILSQTSFLPTNFSTSSAITQQRILNAISPFSQKFLINSSGGTTPTLTVTPLSGTFDSDDGTTLVTSFSGQSGSIKASSGTPMQQISVLLSDSNQSPIQTVSLGQKNFTTQDLQNGIALNVHIFPPSTSSSQAQYVAFATLRTLDGLKLHKIQFQPFSTQPAELSISYGSPTTPQFATIFLNSTASASSQAIGLLSPMNLRCSLQQTSSGTLNISML